MSAAKASKINLEHEHLAWLIKSRKANQESGLRLLGLLDKHAPIIKRHLHSTKKAQMLVAVCFSHWRAAFLADKTGVREAVFKDAREFLVKMLTDNAIAYAQDRASREWTFNYYMNCARDCLLTLSKDWPDVERDLNAPRKVAKGTPVARRRWDRQQNAFETALESFKKMLEAQTS